MYKVSCIVYWPAPHLAFSLNYVSHTPLPPSVPLKSPWTLGGSNATPSFELFVKVPDPLAKSTKTGLGDEQNVAWLHCARGLN